MVSRPSLPGAMDLYSQKREEMVVRQIAGRGVLDPNVLRAMATVPRHLFIPPTSRHLAYGDHPVAIGCEQTISQPYIVAFMTEQLHLRPQDTVLEIGTGSGYQAAVLAQIASRVITLEIRPQLADAASTRLRDLGYTNVEVLCADGFNPCTICQSYPRMIGTAAPSHIPEALTNTLALGGRLILPVGNPWAVQNLLAITRSEDGAILTHQLLAVRFVPMIHQDPTKNPRRTGSEDL